MNPIQRLAGEVLGYSPVSVLDQGYVQFVEAWGADERIIEAARMSTGKGFQGWEGSWGGCSKYPSHVQDPTAVGIYVAVCHECGSPRVHTPGDEKLLAYLYNNKHMTPFEMAGMVIEVKAPIFVFREWHRHRTQSYNEMSGRYIPLPDENYLPSMPQLMPRILGQGTTKQAGAAVSKVPTNNEVSSWLARLESLYFHAQSVYDQGLELGIPKEVARLPVPVARYSRMRASTNLRNWLAFLTLRDHPHAQWEIRQYAIAVGALIEECFPRTWALFKQEPK